MRLVWKSPFGVKRWEGEWPELLERAKWCLRANRVDQVLTDIGDVFV